MAETRQHSGEADNVAGKQVIVCGGHLSRASCSVDVLIGVRNEVACSIIVRPVAVGPVVIPTTVIIRTVIDCSIYPVFQIVRGLGQLKMDRLCK